uniref:Ig-like domain-containing protein n=1 Tax=Anabas testudineus TaxID=64144 RepID=A0A3Q1IXT4_ANATE
MIYFFLFVSVNYPDSVCAVKGSTVTLHCSFTPLRFIKDQNGRKIILKVIRVRWCQNHPICQGTTPSVIDSQLRNNHPRYQYLGDLKDNCTLQIRDVQETDNAILRFRMETNYTSHFTEQSGVNVTGSKMRINSSTAETEVTWFRDGHALSESGPALQLGPLTAKDSGNYTCALKTNSNTRSESYSLFAKAAEKGLFDHCDLSYCSFLTSLAADFIISKHMGSMPYFVRKNQSTDCGTVTTEEQQHSPDKNTVQFLIIFFTEIYINTTMSVHLVLFTVNTVLVFIVASIVIKR